MPRRPLLIILLAFAAATQARASECDRLNAYAAGVVVDYLDSWDNVYHFLGQFHSCYDASIAEGLNDSIYRLLADNWDSLPKMLKLAESDTAFRDFVYQRIEDEMFPQDLLSRVLHHAKYECPAQANDFCQAVIAGAAATMDAE